MIKLGSQFLPGHLHIGNLEGNLISSCTLRNIDYQNDNTKLVVKHLNISWQPLALLNQQIRINAIGIDKIAITTIGTQSPGRLSFPDYPHWLRHFTFVFNKLVITDLTVTKANKKMVQIDNLTVLKNQQNYLINILSPVGRFDGNVWVYLYPHLTWQFHLTATHVNTRPLNPEVASDINFILNSNGEWGAKKQRFFASVNDLQGQLHQYPLTGQMAIKYDQGQFNIDHTHLNISDAHLILAGSLKDNWSIQWTLRIPQINKITPTIDGVIASSGKILGPKHLPTVEAYFIAKNVASKNLTIKEMSAKLNSRLFAEYSTDIDMTMNALKVKDNIFPYVYISDNTQLQNKKCVNHINLALSQHNRASGTVILFKESNHTVPSIDGKIDINFLQLQDFLTKIPAIKNPKGTVKAQVFIKGKLTEPQFTMTGSLQHGQVDLPKLGIKLTDIHLQSSYDLQGLISYKGKFASHPGQAELSGTIDPKSSDHRTKMQVYGRNLKVLNLEKYKVNVSPDLTLSYQNNEISIEGHLTIPYADLKVNEFNNVVTLPEEVVYIDRHPKQNIPTNITTKVHVLLGNDIKIAYDKLQAQLKGSLLVTERAGTLPVAIGELHTIQGKYQAYGHLLTIRKGQLMYNGNLLTDPGLDIQAVKQIKSINFAGQSQFTHEVKSVYTGSGTLNVGVRVSGTLKKPQTILFSEPAGISQEDILSYLVFGYPRSKINNASSLTLLHAMMANSNKSGVGGMTQKIQKAFNLAELSVGSTTYFNPAEGSSANATTLNVGKKINDHICLNYSIGFFNPIQIFSITYQLTKHLSAKTETSSFENGADLLYEYEKD